MKSTFTYVALGAPKVRAHLPGKKIRSVIFVSVNAQLNECAVWNTSLSLYRNILVMDSVITSELPLTIGSPSFGTGCKEWPHGRRFTAQSP
jgi:hypothetical protein